MNWRLSTADHRIWEGRQDGVLVAMIRWEAARGVYIDREGQSMGNNFNKARDNAEKGVAKPGQMGLSL